MRGLEAHSRSGNAPRHVADDPHGSPGTFASNLTGFMNGPQLHLETRAPGIDATNREASLLVRFAPGDETRRGHLPRSGCPHRRSATALGRHHGNLDVRGAAERVGGRPVVDGRGAEVFIGEAPGRTQRVAAARGETLDAVHPVVRRDDDLEAPPHGDTTGRSLGDTFIAACPSASTTADRAGAGRRTLSIGACPGLTSGHSGLCQLGGTQARMRYSKSPRPSWTKHPSASVYAKACCVRGLGGEPAPTAVLDDGANLEDGRPHWRGAADRSLRDEADRLRARRWTGGPRSKAPRDKGSPRSLIEGDLYVERYAARSHVTPTTRDGPRLPAPVLAVLTRRCGMHSQLGRGTNRSWASRNAIVRGARSESSSRRTSRSLASTLSDSPRPCPRSDAPRSPTSRRAA